MLTPCCDDVAAALKSLVALKKITFEKIETISVLAVKMGLHK